jgi:hypothetical protein
MSDSADAIGFSDPDLDARLNFHTPTNKLINVPKPVRKLPDAARNGRAENKRLDFPSANLGRMRVADQKSAESEKKQPVKRESAALLRMRRREKERELRRVEKAERRAKQLAIEEGQELELDWRKRLKVLSLAWIVGLAFNALILIYLWCYVSSWGQDRQPLSLTFSAIEVQDEELAEVNFSLPAEVTPEEDEAEFEEALVEVLVVDAAMDWTEEPDPTLDALAKGLFDSVDPGASKVPGDSDDGGSKGTSFFGIEGSGDRLVFVVDCSGSMGHEMRFQRAVYELGQSLRLMDDNQEFLVVLYNDRIYPMLDTPLMQTKAIRATEENVERVLKWVKYQRPVGSTFPARALRGSLEVQPSSVFFLSDGELMDDTLGMLRKMNVSNSATGAKKIPVHTVTLGSTGIGAGMMRVIADENEGRFVWAK